MRWRNDDQRENLFRRVALVILRDDGTLSLKLLDAVIPRSGLAPRNGTLPGRHSPVTLSEAQARRLCSLRRT